MKGKVIHYVDSSTGAEATIKLDILLGEGAFGAVYKAYVIEADSILKFPDVLAWK